MCCPNMKMLDTQLKLDVVARSTQKDATYVCDLG